MILKQNDDWRILSSILNIDVFKLKFKVFSYLKPYPQTKIWSSEQDYLLIQTIKY